MAGTSTTDWQDQLDSDFPNGLVVYYGNPEIGVPVSGLHVIDTVSGRPRVCFADLGDTKTWDDVLLTYTTTQEEPVKVVEASGRDLGKLTFSGNLKGDLARQAGQRREKERSYMTRIRVS